MGEGKGRGVRYTPEQKQEVLDFIKANPGRGAIKQAQDRFGVSYVALRQWLEASGETRPTRARRGTGAERAPADDARFERAKKLLDRIRDAEAEVRGLYAELQGLLRP